MILETFLMCSRREKSNDFFAGFTQKLRKRLLQHKLEIMRSAHVHGIAY